jgi:hypothetical protein
VAGGGPLASGFTSLNVLTQPVVIKPIPAANVIAVIVEPVFFMAHFLSPFAISFGQSVTFISDSFDAAPCEWHNQVVALG